MTFSMLATLFAALPLPVTVKSCIDVDGERERHGVEVERVATFARVLGDGVVAPTIVEGIHVIARAADECVVTKSTVEGVVTRVADERVVAIAARRALDIDERAR